MSRNVNLLSATEADFGAGGTLGTGEWALYSSPTAFLRRIEEVFFYPKYNPTTSRSDFIGKSLGVISDGTNSITVKSGWVPVSSSTPYIGSIFVFSGNNDFDVTLDMEFSTNNSGTGDTYSSDNTLSQPVTITLSTFGDQTRLFNQFTSRSTDNFARMCLTITGGSGSNLAVKDGLYFYDPVIGEDSLSRYGRTSNAAYNSLPAFMRLDDENINNLTSEPQMNLPLRRFLESLVSYADDIAEEAKAFEYVRPTEGTESKSKLTDPDTAKAEYLAWLASVTATTLLVSGAGFTPWSALEAYDGGDAGTTPGEWTDIETFADWLALQAHNPDFFDNIQSFRDQIRTGFTGIHAGRPDTIESFVRTMLDSATSATDAVTVSNDDKDNPFLVEVLVDPNADPDPSGTLIIDAVNNGLSSGATATKTSQVAESGRGSFAFSESVYPATIDNAAGGGVVFYGPSFVSDRDGLARNLLLNASVSSSYPEVGGGVGHAHYDSGSEFFYGKISGSTFSKLETASSTYAELGANTAGFDLIAVLTDVTMPTAPVDTSGSGGNTPADWLYRQKRLIACGVDSTGAGDNDWALYLVSGSTVGPDNEARILLIEGYEAVGANNYAVSDPINLNTIGKDGDLVLRVQRGAVSGTATVKFYAQASLYDDWAGNIIGTSTITPSTTAAGSAHARLQILGELNASDNWADANALSCGVKRFMLYKTPLTFSGDSDTSSSAHAYVDGNSTNTFGRFTYSPDLDVNLNGVTIYKGNGDNFNASTSETGTTVQVNITADGTAEGDKDLDLLAMRRIGGTTDTWYFGHAASGGDTLTINGLSNSTAYDVIPRIVNTTTGGASNTTHSLTTDGSGVLTISATTVYDGGSATYGGLTLNQIVVQPNGGGSNVAKFLPTTIGTGATTGADSVNASNTWTLTRNFPGSSATSYAPSQLINKESIHFYEGSPSLHNVPPLESHSPFSVFLQIRRFWTASAGTDYDIFKILNATNQGLKIFYDGPAIKATFTDGSNTETVTWTESPTYGTWHKVVVRRDGANGLSLVINGTEESTATLALNVPFTTSMSSATFSEGAASTFNSRFGLAQFAFYNRRLSDTEITLLNSQIT